jgi:hypothetical protein
MGVSQCGPATFTVQSSQIWHRAVHYKSADVSEVSFASIFKVEEYAKKETHLLSFLVRIRGRCSTEWSAQDHEWTRLGFTENRGLLRQNSASPCWGGLTEVSSRNIRCPRSQHPLPLLSPMFHQANLLNKDHGHSVKVFPLR